MSKLLFKIKLSADLVSVLVYDGRNLLIDRNLDVIFYGSDDLDENIDIVKIAKTYSRRLKIKQVI